MLDLSFHQTR